MNKKVIIISIVAVIVIAGLAFAALYYFRQSTTDPADVTQPLTVDTSKDFGACTLVSKDLIRSTLGTTAANVQGPDNVGLVQVKNGQTQTCVYAFVTGGNIENSFNIANAFSVDVLAYSDQTAKDNDQTTLSALEGAITVSNLGDNALFRTISGEGQTRERHVLTVFKDLKSYSFTISQPTEAATFDATEAQAMLGTIAASATF